MNIHRTYIHTYDVNMYIFCFAIKHDYYNAKQKLWNVYISANTETIQ